MSGNMHRWVSNEWLPTDDTLSQCSASQHSDVSADDQFTSSSPDISQRLRILFKEQLYTDVKFVISHGKKPKPSISAHKAVLAIGSDKFREILYENGSQDGNSELQINNIPFEAFKNVVEYLYTDDAIFDNDQSVLDTLSAASIFQVQGLVDKCESYIESMELTDENVCSKYQIASNNNLTLLRNKCLEFIKENTEAVLRSADFLAANITLVRTICKQEKLNLRSEIELLNGLVRYAESHQEGKSKREFIEPFLKHIRLLNVSCAEFSTFVQKHPNIFTAPEATTVLISLANPANPSPNLPNWCTSGSNRCTFQTRSHERERRENVRMNTRLFIFLRPCRSKEQLSNLVCMLEMKCFRGNHKVEGLKFSFDDPVHESSVIGHLIISVDVKPSKYHFEEHIKIENSKNVELRFSKRLFTKRGDTIYIRAEAREVKNYKFLQFDESNSFSCDSPFTCSLGSVPKENRLFFISEVVYHSAPPPVMRNPFPNSEFRDRRRPRCRR